MLKKLLSFSLLMLLVLGINANVFAMEETSYSAKDYTVDVPEEYAMVNSGYLELNSDGSVTITDKYKDYVKEKLEENGLNAEVTVNDNSITITENANQISPNTSNIQATASGGGVTKVVWQTYNRFKIYLNNQVSNKVANGVGIVAVLAVWIPDPLVSKIIGTAIGASAGLVAYNNNGNGVIISGIYWLSPPVVTFYWIKPQ